MLISVVGQFEEGVSKLVSDSKASESRSYRFEGLQAASTAIAAGSLPRNTKGPRLGPDICNAGETAFDAVVAKRGRATMFHIPRTQCAHVYEDSAGPAALGFGFADSRNQWWAARKADLLPSEIWSKGSGEALQVRSGNAKVTVPALMLFRPPPATCHSVETSHTEHDPLHPFDARYDRQASDFKSVCDNTEYDLNVVAYPQSREVSFLKKCYACPPSSSPEERQ
jgi:hypothetical protein